MDNLLLGRQTMKQTLDAHSCKQWNWKFTRHTYYDVMLVFKDGGLSRISIHLPPTTPCLTYLFCPSTLSNFEISCDVTHDICE